MKRNLPIVLLVTFIDFLSISVFFGTIIPLVLAKHSLFSLGLDPHMKSVLYGMCLLILPVGQFLITPIWGQLSDQYGRKPILFITLLFSAIGYILIGFAIMSHVFAVFILGRVLTACVAANMPISQASLADGSAQLQKAQRFNLQYIFVSLGFIVGPYLIRFATADKYYANAFWVIAAGYALAFLLTTLLFKETLRTPEDKPMQWAQNFKRIFAIFHSGKLTQIFLLWIMFQLGWSLFFQYSGEFLYLKHHLANDAINFLFSWVGLAIFIIQLALVQPLSYIMAPQRVLPFAIVIIGASLIVMGFLPVNKLFYGFLAIYALGIGFFLTNMSAFISNSAGESQQGRTMAMMASSQSLMDITVTFIGSFVVSYYLPTPYVIGGLIVLASLIFWRRQAQS